LLVLFSCCGRGTVFTKLSSTFRIGKKTTYSSLNYKVFNEKLQVKDWLLQFMLALTFCFVCMSCHCLHKNKKQIELERKIWGFHSNDYAGNCLLGSCAMYFWLEPTFRRNVSPPSSGQVNHDENIVSRCLQMVGSQEHSTYIVSWQGRAGEWEMVGEVGFEWTVNQVLIGMWRGGNRKGVWATLVAPRKGSKQMNRLGWWSILVGYNKQEPGWPWGAI
jgi:hypothetical protein